VDDYLREQYNYRQMKKLKFFSKVRQHLIKDEIADFKLMAGFVASMSMHTTICLGLVGFVVVPYWQSVSHLAQNHPVRICLQSCCSARGIVITKASAIAIFSCQYCDSIS
jgi:hypothetical protein